MYIILLLIYVYVFHIFHLKMKTNKNLIDIFLYESFSIE
jgi:hypothetical protein